MYDESQIQDNMWEDVANIRDHENGPGSSSGKLGIDYVVCGICGLKSEFLGRHYKIHNISCEEYREKFGELICDNKRKFLSKKMKERETWPKEKLENLKKRQREAFRASLTEKERKRRSEMLAALNKTDLFRKKASDTAKITSSRRDIIEKRTENLRRWRQRNPEWMKDNQGLKSFKSIPERKLLVSLNEILDGDVIVSNKYLYSDDFSFNLSNSKQIDMFLKDSDLLIEFDGPLHFKSEFPAYLEIRKKDEKLDEFILKSKYSLIRVDFTNWTYTKNQKDGFFSTESLELIKKILLKHKPQTVYKIGENYGENNLLRTDWRSSDI